MFKRCISILLGLCIAIPQPVLGATGVVRGGEHSGFTRLTVSTESGLSDVQAERTGQRQYALVFTPSLSRVDSSRVFDRLNANRVAAVTPKDGGLEVVLNCDCEPIVTLDSHGLVIVDIAERSADAVANLPLLPSAAGELPPAPRRTFDDAGDDSGVFALDFSVLDRVNRAIAAQIGETTQINGFSELAVPPFEDPIVAAGNLKEDAPTPAPRDRCHWSDAIWVRADGSFQVAESDESKGADLVADASSAFGDAIVVDFLSDGRLDEARIAFLSQDPDVNQRETFAQFEAMLDGTAEPGRLRFGDCNPFDDVLIASLLHEADIPNSVKIDLMNTFGQLPTGLQIALYPKLTWLIGDAQDTLFPELAQHLAAEQALIERLPRDRESAGLDQDPDALAAVSVELRGTNHEKQSWKASFDSYLANQRYFDALRDLADDPPLTETELRRATTDLIDHLVAHADSITFLQVALAVVPDLDPAPSEAALAGISARLSAEGFTAETLSVAQTAPVSEMALGTYSGVSDGGPHNEDRPIPPAAPTPSIVEWTVTMARESAESAQELRRSLAETLSR